MISAISYWFKFWYFPQKHPLAVKEWFKIQFNAIFTSFHKTIFIDFQVIDDNLIWSELCFIFKKNLSVIRYQWIILNIPSELFLSFSFL